MAWFLVFGKPNSDLEFSKSNGQEMATSLCLLIEMCHVSQYEHFELLNCHV